MAAITLGGTKRGNRLYVPLTGQLDCSVMHKAEQQSTSLWKYTNTHILHTYQRAFSHMCTQITVLIQLQACDSPLSLMTAHTHCQRKAPPRRLTALWIKEVSFPLAGRADKPGQLLSFSVRLLLRHSSHSQLYSLFKKTIRAVSCRGTCSFCRGRLQSGSHVTNCGSCSVEALLSSS